MNDPCLQSAPRGAASGSEPPQRSRFYRKWEERLMEQGDIDGVTTKREGQSATDYLCRF